MKRALAGTVALVAALGVACAAAAHGKLLAASPAADATAAGSPAEIRMTFSEAIFPNFSGIVLKDPQGRAIRTGRSHAEADRKQLVVPLAAKLAPGRYTVVWHVVCADTHRMQGQYGFAVK